MLSIGENINPSFGDFDRYRPRLVYDDDGVNSTVLEPMSAQPFSSRVQLGGNINLDGGNATLQVFWSFLFRSSAIQDKTKLELGAVFMTELSNTVSLRISIEMFLNSESLLLSFSPMLMRTSIEGVFRIGSASLVCGLEQEFHEFISYDWSGYVRIRTKF